MNQNRPTRKGPKIRRVSTMSKNLSVRPGTPKAQPSSEMKFSRLLTRTGVVICGLSVLAASANLPIWKTLWFILYTTNNNNSSPQTHREITIRGVMGVKLADLEALQAEVACQTLSSKLHRLEECSIAALGDPKIITLTFSFQCLGKLEEFHRPKITSKVRHLRCLEQARWLLLIGRRPKRGKFQGQPNKTRENTQRYLKQQICRQESGVKVIW